MKVLIISFGILTVLVFIILFLMPWVFRKVMWIKFRRAIKKIAKSPSTGPKVKQQLNELTDMIKEISKKDEL